MSSTGENELSGDVGFPFPIKESSLAFDIASMKFIWCRSEKYIVL